MATINKNYDKLAKSYLFPEIKRRTAEFQQKNPDAQVIKLGLGNTTEPLTPSALKGLTRGVQKLADRKSYSGYGDEIGNVELREAIAQDYVKRGIPLTAEEVFANDGAKGATANIQQIFGSDNVVAVQDPVYPVYVDSTVMYGKTSDSKDGHYGGIVYMECTEENGFVPEPPQEKVDIIYLCSPNNPTGAVATKEQLKKFVDYAIENKAVIIFDAAYAEFVKDSSLPKSIYEVEGAKKCAIEINSFSKSAGFTGVRLGWAVVPKDLVVEGTESGKVNWAWNRRESTMFNGPSNVVQEAGLELLTDEGKAEWKKLVEYYMENAKLIKQCFDSLGIKSIGGVNSPYIWLKVPDGTSWDFFDKLLNECHVIGTPGSGFGPAGEGYFRLSAFGHREDIEEAVRRIKEKLQL